MQIPAPHVSGFSLHSSISVQFVPKKRKVIDETTCHSHYIGQHIFQRPKPNETGTLDNCCYRMQVQLVTPNGFGPWTGFYKLALVL